MGLPHFEINAAVVRQLGEELVSDEVTALIELVKNSYDADASYVNIVVDTNNIYPHGESLLTFQQHKPSYPGYILVEDDGIGMTRSEIESGWLTISYSSKRTMKQLGGLTPLKKRTPLGEKGLGRLSTQRLGNRLEMLTIRDPSLSTESEKNVQHHVAFDWSDFSEDKTLTTVPVEFVSRPVNNIERGTKLIISDLCNPSIWETDSQSRLITQLSQLIFPFEEVRTFRVYLTINGVEIDLHTISAELRELSLSHFDFKYERGRFIITGKIKLPRLGTGDKNDDTYNRLLAVDQGRAFFEYLADSTHSPHLSGITYLNKGGWFIQIDKEIALISMSGLIVDREGGIYDPGKFHGEMDEFFLRGIDLSEEGSTLGSLANYREFVRKHVGVRIYRDGFGIRPYGLGDNDWLGLGKGQTSGRSFYSPRPNNVIGYVALTASENSQLKEKTDREGFIESPYSLNFFTIMGQFVTELDILFNTLRRSYNTYKSALGPERKETSVRGVVEEIQETSKQAVSLSDKIDTLDEGLATVTETLQVIVDKVQNTPLLASSEELALSPAIIEAEKRLVATQGLIGQLRSMISGLTSLSGRANALESQITLLEDQLLQFSELAGLGLTAEALSHEIHLIADQLAERTKTISDSIRKKELIERNIITYTEYVKSAISSLRKQLSHLAPSLRYVRENKDIVDLQIFLTDLQTFYQDGRFRRSNIGLEVIADSPELIIRMNKGKLTQILDNLILNSEYWLKQAVRQKSITNPKIMMLIAAPYLKIQDNGYGIDPSITDTLFEPFVTTKPKAEGRGLGLFIVKELLDSSGCSISLLPEYNQFNRRYIFQIDFTGALYDQRKVD